MLLEEPMSAVAKIAAKGQTTIPQDVRAALHVPYVPRSGYCWACHDRRHCTPPPRPPGGPQSAVFRIHRGGLSTMYREGFSKYASHSSRIAL